MAIIATLAAVDQAVLVVAVMGVEATLLVQLRDLQTLAAAAVVELA